MSAPRHERLARDLANLLAVTVGNGDPVEPAIARMADRLAEYERVVETNAGPTPAQVADRLRGLTLSVRTGRGRQAAVRSGPLTDESLTEVVDTVLGVTR